MVSNTHDLRIKPVTGNPVTYLLPRDDSKGRGKMVRPILNLVIIPYLPLTLHREQSTSNLVEQRCNANGPRTLSVKRPKSSPTLRVFERESPPSRDDSSVRMVPFRSTSVTERRPGQTYSHTVHKLLGTEHVDKCD